MVLLTVVLGCVAAFYGVRGVAFTARIAVAPNEHSFAKFASVSGAPYRLTKVLIRGNSYYVWIGDPAGTLQRLGSGPPCYVFDSSGTLVGWSPVTNDGHCEPLSSAAYGPAAQALTVDDALRSIASQRSGLP